MNIKNYEFKVKVEDLEKYERQLLELNPTYQGLDHQIDTYFKSKIGRLKLREGNIENSLINYDRENISGAKESQIILYQHEPNIALKNILSRQFGVKVIVDKKRKIYFINNVKFHFDIVDNLGTFIEVEAIDNKEEFTTQELKEQCDKYFYFFKFTNQNIVDKSYSDLILERIEKIVTETN
jgi:adenylate cyclase class IV